MRKEGFLRSEAKEAVFYIFLGLFMTIFIPIGLGFIGKQFGSSFITGKPLFFGDFITTWIIYIPFIIVGLFGLIFPIARLISIDKNEHPATQKNPSWFRIFTVSFIFSPEENGFIYWLSDKVGFKDKRNLMNWSLSIFRVFIVATLVFGLLAILQVWFPVVQGAALPSLKAQSITGIANVYFNTEPPAWAETMTLLFILSILSGIFAYICAKFKLGIGVWFALVLLIACPLTGFSWMGIHNLVYGNQEVSLFSTFIFGWLGATFTVLTGTVFFWYMWHFWNNIFAALVKLISAKEDIVFLALGIWLIILVSFSVIEFYLYRRRKRERQIVYN